MSAEPRRLVWIAPLVICLLALGLRFWYLGEARNQLDFEQPVVDAGYHDYWAWGIVSGEWTLPPGAHVDPEIDSRPYFRPPLTAYWLAAIFKVAGHNHVATRVVQLLLGTASCLLLMLLGARLFDRATGTIAGLLAAGYWIFAYFDMEYREVSLLVFLYPALALSVLRWRDRSAPAWAATAGILLGLAILARPNGLLLVPAVAAWAWYVTREEQPAGLLRDAAVFVLAVAACVLPVTARNAIAGDDLVLVSSNGGINLYIGNNPQANGTAVALPPEIPPFDSAFDYRGIVHRVSEVEGRPLSDSETSRWFATRAFAHVADQPLRTLKVAGKKVLAFWGGREIVSEKNLALRRQQSTALRAVPLDVSAVIVGALLGAVFLFAGRREFERRDVGLIFVLLGTYFVSLLPFFVTARFRAPMIPFLLVLFAYALRRLFLLGRSRKFAPLALALAALAAGYALHRPGVEVEPADIAADLAARGARLASEGRIDEAEQTLRRAVSADPANGMARNNLGLLLGHLGRNEEAVEHLEAAIRLDGADPRPHQNLALTLLQAGALQRALVHFERASELAPTNPAVALEAGGALLDAGRPIFAADHLERACALAPDDAEAHFALGVARLRLGEFPAAVGALEKALELGPGEPAVENALREARAAIRSQRP